jgi:oxygen-independent coproporphyrinogen-3 oxidase
VSERATTGGTTAGGGAVADPEAAGGPSASAGATGGAGATTAGNYFISNYPPYSFWRAERRGEALAALERPPAPGTPLGLYVHIPFCRKRCHFCYFRIYTEKSAAEIGRYLDALAAELALYARTPFVRGRRPTYVYLGGGTPSLLSARQLARLVGELSRILPWEGAEEVTLECEPGTLTEAKVAAMRELGVTRPSLGIEHFDEEVLRANGRAHGAAEIDRAFGWLRAAGFADVNIDLIAGMVGDTEEKWRRAVERTIELAPDSVTVYPLEVPHNTTLYREMKAKGLPIVPAADWPTKERWRALAFERLESRGYALTSAYTAVRDAARPGFVWRERFWRGGDLVGVGVSSYGYAGGTHAQNEHDWAPYLSRVEAGELPILRALALSDEERMVRELVLQLKLGPVSARRFRERFGVDIRERFSEALGRLRAEGRLLEEGDALGLARPALLQADRFLPELFLRRHRNARYT